VRIPRSRRSLCSPELDLTFEERQDGRPGIRPRCLPAPRSEAWTGFAFPYAALVSIDAIYAAGYIGRGLSIDQRYQLQRCLDGCIEAAEHRFRIERATPVDFGRIRRWVTREVHLEVEVREARSGLSGPPRG
jgi:hypothetical protein